MCASCGVAGHVPAVTEPAAMPAEPAAPGTPPTTPPAAPRKFAALRNRDCRPYLFGAVCDKI